jgi:hypothetical protein
MNEESSSFDRRQFLKTVAGTSLALATVDPLNALAQSPNPIVLENAKAGTADWSANGNPALGGEIEGYASATSVNKGGSISLFVSTAEPTFTLQVFRLGWYGGLGARLVRSAVTLPGVKQPTPTPDPATGLLECNWRQSYQLTTGTSWVSGMYFIRLTAGVSKKQAYIRFVLRDDARATKLLFQSSVTTDQAYNNWGGKSLYTFNSTGAPAHKVSFNRPYSRDSIGSGNFFQWEFRMMRFLEREGYDVKYCSNVDTHANSSLLQACKGFLSVGHDEYWTFAMRQNVEAARDRGTHLGFFSANSCYWQIRLDPSPLTGALNRTVVCYKLDYPLDPFFGVDNRLVTTRWRDIPVNRPEATLLGVQSDFFDVNTDFVVEDASHWLFAGAGVKNGDKLPGLVGYEVDWVVGLEPPTLRRVGHSPINNGTPGFSDMTIYTSSVGSYVFATGTMHWAFGLDSSALVSPAAQQLTRNFLARVV